MNKILIVEDNELNLKLMKDILEAQSYYVDTASDGQDGLAKAMENEYSLIILDIQMPVVSGYDFLRAYDKKVPVIVVSACAMENEVNKAKELGCVDYISKPIQLVEFLNTVKKYVNK